MSQEPAAQNSNVFKYATIALAAILVIGAGAWYVSSNNKKQAAAEAALVTAKAELDAQKAALGAQKEKEAAGKASMGKKSANLYATYFRQTTSARLTAISIRKTAEEIKTSLSKDPGMAKMAINFDIKQAVNHAALYFAQAVKLRESLDLRGIDPDLITFIDKHAALDNAAKKAFEDYAVTGEKPDEEISRIRSKREKITEVDEVKLLSKFKDSYGITLDDSELLQTKSVEDLDAKSKAYASKLTESDVARQFVGRSFTNLTSPNGAKWQLQAAEFVNGSFKSKKGSEGLVFALVVMEVRNPRSNLTAQLLAMVVFAKPASDNILDWPMILSWAP